MTEPIEFSDQWDLPAQVDEELDRAREIKWLRLLADWSAWLIMVVGFVVGLFWIWPFGEDLNRQAALAAARSVEAYLFDFNFGFGLFIWLIAWGVLSSTISGLICRVLPAPFKTAFFLGLYEDRNLRPFNKTALRRVLEKKSDFDSASDLTNRWAEAFSFATAKYGVPLVVLGALLFWSDVNRYHAFSEDGYYSASWLPWGDEKLVPWSEADRVELGCNQTRDGSSLVYKVFFSDGATVRVDGAVSANDGTWLDGIEAIDRALQKHDVRYSRWRWLKRNPLHPRCVRGYLGQLDDDEQDRFSRLLRIGGFSDDQTHLEAS